MTGAGGVSIRYTVMAMTGLSDPTKTLECLDQQPLYWDAFADAKAAVIARADMLRDRHSTEISPSRRSSTSTSALSGPARFRGWILDRHQPALGEGRNHELDPEMSSHRPRGVRATRATIASHARQQSTVPGPPR